MKMSIFCKQLKKIGGGDRRISFSFSDFDIGGALYPTGNRKS